MQAILAMDDKGGIGKGNRIPWKSSDDMQFFRLLTVGSTIVMGSETYRSLGKPLRDRHNVVISTTLKQEDHPCVKIYENLDWVDNDWVCIGGAKLLNSAIHRDLISSIYISRISGDFDCDVKLELPSNFELVVKFSPKGTSLVVEKWNRKGRPVGRNVQRSTQCDFFFRTWLDSDNETVSVSVWCHATGDRNASSESTESYIEESVRNLDMYQETRLDPTKNWEVIGKGRIRSWFSFDGEYDETIDLYQLQSVELPDDYFEPNTIQD